MVMSAANDYSTLVKKEAQAEQKLVSKRDNVRERVLTSADSLVNGDRNVSYGDPTEDFKRTAKYWNTHLMGVLSRKMGGNIDDLDPSLRWALEDLIDTWDVAIMMNLLKISRLSWSPTKEDHWIDTAGYAACGAECVDVFMNGHQS
jgi:hypothetical protein